MLIYNVTINVDPTIHDLWFDWMREVHIPDVMGTGCFSGYRMLKMLTVQDGEEGVTYAIQYEAETMDDYVRYQELFAPDLQKQTFAQFGDRYLAFRTLLEVV